MQNKLQPGPLLFGDGNLSEAGYAFDLVKEYDRSAIKANKLRIKEWDYYYIGNANYGVALTIADNSYMSLVSVSLLDFNAPFHFTKSFMKFMSKGRLNLPSTSKTGDVSYHDKHIDIEFLNNNGERHLICHIDKFKDEQEFRADIYLTKSNDNSMVIATPFNKQHHFYYNQKINLLIASGYAKCGNSYYDFNKDSYGVLDWGRGVWTYKNTWYWSSLSGKYNNHLIGFNLGYGFGNNEAASENMLFVDDKAYKLDDVVFDIPIAKNGKDDFMKPWKFRSKNGDISLVFTPIIDRFADANALIIRSLQHQVFGIFSGYFIVDNNKIEINNVVGFAEKVMNRW
jgi:hypothetical protein